MKPIKWTAAVAAIILLFCLCLCACSDGGDITSESPKTPRTSRTTRRAIDVTIESLLTREQISEILSVPMKEPTVTRGGTHLFALSEDGSLSVQVGLEKQTAEQFERLIGDKSAAEAAPNLGRQAWWLAAKRMLLVYEGTYSLSVSIAYEDYTDDDALFVSRQLAVAILDGLSA